MKKKKRKKKENNTQVKKYFLSIPNSPLPPNYIYCKYLLGQDVFFLNKWYEKIWLFIIYLLR